MAPDVYAVHNGTSPKFGRAFAAGCGGMLYFDSLIRTGPVAMFGSPALWSVLQEAQTSGHDWFYGDHAYFGRFQFYRVTRNAWQHDGSGDAGPERFRLFGIEITPWQRDGRHVLVCPPDGPFAKLMGFDADAWLADVLAQLGMHTERPVTVRRRDASTPLAEALRDCWALVTYMSNAAVEAVLAGVPVFCLGPCAARTMGLSDLSLIESPIRPDGREQWAWNLASNQWTLSEIASGECWRAIGR